MMYRMYLSKLEKAQMYTIQNRSYNKGIYADVAV